MWNFQYKYPDGYVNKTPWFRFGEPFKHEVGFSSEMFEIVVVTHGSNQMLVKLTPEVAGKREVEVILEFTKYGQMIFVVHLPRKGGPWYSFLRLFGWGMNDMEKGLEERAYFKKVKHYVHN